MSATTQVLQSQPVSVTTAQTYPLAEKLVARVGLPRHPEMPAEFSERWKLAEAFTEAGIVPEGYREKDGSLKVARVFVALQYAAELGLSPALGLQKIAVINNVASLEFKAKLALAKSSGLLEDAWGEWNEGRTACTYRVKRAGDARLHVRTFTMEDARQAKLLDKFNWKAYPADMLLARAGGRALDEAFPELFMGLPTPDEAEDYAAPPRATGADATGPGSPAPRWRLSGDLWLELTRTARYRKMPAKAQADLIADATGGRDLAVDPKTGVPTAMTEAEYGALKRAFADWKAPAGSTTAPPTAPAEHRGPTGEAPPPAAPTPPPPAFAPSSAPIGADLFGGDDPPKSEVPPAKLARICELVAILRGKAADPAEVVSEYLLEGEPVGDLALLSEKEADLALKSLEAAVRNRKG